VGQWRALAIKSGPFPAYRSRDRQWAQLAGPDLLNRQRRAPEQDLYLSAKQVSHHRAPATIRHVNHFDASHHLEQLAGYMAGGSDTGRSQIDLARAGLGIGDELGNRFGRNGWIYHHDQGEANDASDRGDVTEKNETELVVERRVR